MIKDKEVISKILSELTIVTGYNICVAGGAVRDLIHGKQIKDVDIELFANGEVIPFERVECIEKSLIDVGIPHYVDYAYDVDDCDNSELFAVVRIPSYFPYPIDIIIRNEPADTLEGVVSCYDLNINQVVLHNDIVYSFTRLGTKVVSNGDRLISEARRDHLAEKYPEYDFSEVKLIPATFIDFNPLLILNR